ncbi:MAG TPA: GNAT family N-acetyltransferase [Ideonella sp.]|nr:GNAT family N-acetyltransferase [Ideonella sp.]
METSPSEPGKPATPWTLRRARASDAEAFARLMAEPEVFGNLMQLPFPDAELWRARLATHNPPDKADLHLVADVGGVVVGSAGLNTAGTALRRRHVMDLGMSVDLAWQRRGVGSALMEALCMYADRWAGVLRLELTVFADNVAALALYRKFGFEQEGLHRGYAMRDGEYVDAYCMARLHPHLPRWSGTPA